LPDLIKYRAILT